MKKKKITYKQLRALSERIWNYLNGRYEDYNKEVDKITQMMEDFINRRRKL